MRKLLLLAGCLLAAALFVSACGDSESDEDKIASVIETSATSTDPADCEALNTIAFLEQMEFEAEGQKAVESCEEDAEDDSENPDSVSVEEVEVDGSSATAQATFVGGGFDGQTLAISVVEEDGDWKVDSLDSFVDFDQAKLIEAFEESLTGPDGLDDEELTGCFIEEIEAASPEEAEEVMLSQDAFLELFESCG